MNRPFLRRVLPGVAAVGALAALAPAYILLNPPRKWFAADLPRDFKICMGQGEDSLAAGFTQQACASAVAVWSAAVGGNPFTSTVVSTGNVGFVNDGLSTISFEDPQHLLSGGTLGASSVGFYTTSQTTVTNGTTFFRYLDSDVVGNNGVAFTSVAEAESLGANGSQYDMEGLMVQEVGHSLGLDHPSIEQASMYGFMNSNDWRKRDLDDDDINGIRFCYVQNPGTTTFPAGTQLVADTTFLGLSTATLKPNSKVYVRVTIVDENKNTVSGANVTVSVTRPNGTIGTGTAATSSTGRVTFDTGSAQTASPGYTVTVTNVTKAGMTFNAGAGDPTDAQDF